jgi:hypothetical protein
VRRLVAAVAAIATTLGARTAWADQVAVLKFTPASGTTPPRLVDGARRSTQQAVERLAHTLPPTAQAYAADVVVPDGTPDTTKEYRDAGRASGSQWTVAGRVEAHGWAYRLELEACRVDSGRVESLAREIDLRQPVPQIAEMLALLLRPEGVGVAAPPWESNEPPPLVEPTSNATPTPTSTTSTSTSTSLPLLPVPEPPVLHPLSLALGLDLLSFSSHVDPTSSSALSSGLTLDLAYALTDAPRLELRALVGAEVIGPLSLRFDLGPRVLFPLGSARRVWLGPEGGVGGFFATASGELPRLWLRGALPLQYLATEWAALEVYPEVGGALGGTASLLVVGAGVRLLVRF